MNSYSYEVEIKCLLDGGEETARMLREQMRNLDPDCKHLGKESQLNHYFIEGNPQYFFEQVRKCLRESDAVQLRSLISRARDYSLRTRKTDTELLLVLKASVDDTTSANGTARIEFEATLPSFTLEELDTLLLNSGFQYQSKWSRVREKYCFLGMNVSIDKNAGYGYIAEFEVVEDDKKKVESTKARIRETIGRLGLKELPQERLERMFAYYNAHWPQYYGTEKTFSIY